MPFLVSVSARLSIGLGPGLAALFEEPWSGSRKVEAEVGELLVPCPNVEPPMGDQLVLCGADMVSSCCLLRIYPLLPTVEPWGGLVSDTPFSRVEDWAGDPAERFCSVLFMSVFSWVPFSSLASLRGLACPFEWSSSPPIRKITEKVTELFQVQSNLAQHIIKNKAEHCRVNVRHLQWNYPVPERQYFWNEYVLLNT